MPGDAEGPNGQKKKRWLVTGTKTFWQRKEKKRWQWAVVGGVERDAKSKKHPAFDGVNASY